LLLHLRHGLVHLRASTNLVSDFPESGLHGLCAGRCSEQSECCEAKHGAQRRIHDQLLVKRGTFQDYCPQLDVLQAVQLFLPQPN
jgi:hypothetical protein